MKSTKIRKGWPDNFGLRLIFLAAMIAATVNCSNDPCRASSGEQQERPLSEAEQLQAYRETRETISQWDEILQMPAQQREERRTALIQNLRKIDPRSLGEQVKPLTLAEIVAIASNIGPEQFQQATLFTISREGALWIVRLRDPSLIPADAIGDDQLTMIYLDGFSGTILFPITRHGR